MIQTLLDSTTIPLLEQVARFNELRQQFLAGNITNLDIPNYKSRDLPVKVFRKALKEAVTAIPTQSRSPRSHNNHNLAMKSSWSSCFSPFSRRHRT